MIRICLAPWFRANRNSDITPIREWLEDNFTAELDGWCEDRHHNSIVFEREEDATAFKLRFGL